MKAVCPYCEDLCDIAEIKRIEKSVVRDLEVEAQSFFSVCKKCNGEFSTPDQMELSLQNAYAVYRQETQVISAVEIIHIRELYGASQKAFAKILDLGELTINSLENGSLPTKSISNLIQLMDNPENFSRLLKKNSHKLSEFQVEKIEKRLTEREKMFSLYQPEEQELMVAEGNTGYDIDNKRIKDRGVGIDSLIGLFEQTQTAMQTQAAKSVDIALVVRNWLFGWYIVEFENGGAERAKLYGKALIKRLSNELKKIGIKGMSETNLRKFREFYQGYAQIQQTLSVTSLTQQTLLVAAGLPENIWQKLTTIFSLSWSHYVVLLTVDAEDERRFYELEATENSWGIRELKRQINSSLYERLALSRDKAGVKELAGKGQIITKPSDVLKSPYVLEFLGLQERSEYSEHELETAIIDKIEHFLLELGKGFLFEARQKRFSFDDDHFYVDLVFYNRLLHCYVIVDLKRERLTHQDLGQMQMYVNYFDRYVKQDDEKPTVGILLCHSKNDRLVELTLPKDANIHASAYQLYLPDKEALKRQLEEAQAEWELSHEELTIEQSSKKEYKSIDSGSEKC